MPPSPKHPPPGTVVGGRYRIDTVLGEGGFGVVYRATQLNLGRAVALKVIRPQALTEEGLARFQREAEIFQRLEHPNVVRLVDFGNDGPGGSPFLVFELLHGRTLDAALRMGGAFPTARVARVSAQILKALMEAHARGIVHRDVKPANIFLSDFQGEKDFVKVIDFGLAKGEGARTLTQQGGIVGTVPYMAPEQVDGREVGFAADLFAVGLTMSEMIAGRPVMIGLDVAAVVGVLTGFTPIPHTLAALQSPFAPVIHRATQKSPQKRYPSAAEMLAHLDAVVAYGLPGSTQPGDPRASDPRASDPRVSDPPGPGRATPAPATPAALGRATPAPATPATPARATPVPAHPATPERATPARVTPVPAYPPTNVYPTQLPVEEAPDALAGAGAPLPIPPTHQRPPDAPDTAPMLVPPRGAIPVVPPAPGRGAPRKGRVPWGPLGAVAGVLVLGGGVVAAIVGTGAVDLGAVASSGSASASARAVSSAPSPAVAAPGVHWLGVRSELEVAEVDANGDGVVDFVGFCSDDARTRVSLCAVDGATFQLLWRRPLTFDLLTDLHLSASGRSVAFVDPRGTVRLFDAATGAPQGAAPLGSRAERVCAPSEMPGKLWIRLRERPAVAFDVASRAVAESLRPPSCTRGPGEPRCFVLQFDPASCPPEPGEPRPADASVHNVFVEGPNGVAIGSKRGDASVPMILGFTPAPRDREGGEPRIRWIRPLAPGDGLGAVRSVFFLALQGGRAVTWYDHTSGRPHVVALDAAGGRTLWEVPTREVASLQLTSTRVYVQHREGLDVRDAPTGRLLGSVGKVD